MGAAAGFFVGKIGREGGRRGGESDRNENRSCNNSHMRPPNWAYACSNSAAEDLWSTRKVIEWVRGS